MIVRAAAKPKQVNRYARFLAGSRGAKSSSALDAALIRAPAHSSTCSPGWPSETSRVSLSDQEATPEWCGTTEAILSIITYRAWTQKQGRQLPGSGKRVDGELVNL